MKTPRSFLLPILRLPVPENPNPEPIVFADFQGLVGGFSKDLAAAEETLVGVGPEVKLRLDLRKVHYDVNGDGKVLEDESFIAVMQQITGLPSDAMPVDPHLRLRSGRRALAPRLLPCPDGHQRLHRGA